jgi:hypothetical protein
MRDLLPTLIKSIALPLFSACGIDLPTFEGGAQYCIDTRRNRSTSTMKTASAVLTNSASSEGDNHGNYQ